VQKAAFVKYAAYSDDSLIIRARTHASPSAEKGQAAEGLGRTEAGSAPHCIALAPTSTPVAVPLTPGQDALRGVPGAGGPVQLQAGNVAEPAAAGIRQGGVAPQHTGGGVIPIILSQARRGGGESVAVRVGDRPRAALPPRI
jgi:hypothetical protein